MAFTKSKSLDKILSVFDKMKSDLTEFIGQETDNASIKSAEVFRLQDEIADHHLNAGRAADVLNNINKLTETTS